MGAVNKRLVYFLVFLVIVLPVITGILVWQLLLECDSDDDGTGAVVNNLNQQTTLAGVPVTSTTLDPFGDGPWRNSRLPKFVIPIHYDIVLFPDFYGNSSWFYGNETVEISIAKATNTILIHAHLLNITSTTLTSGDGNDILLKQAFQHDKNQYWVVETMDTLQANTTVFLFLSFDGDMGKSIVGLYKSTYYNSVTKQYRSIATSKFEPVAARRAFPCFDEPEMKAEFTVTLIHQSTYVPLSNMPVNSSSPWHEDATLNATEFQRSVKMSTYLVCFIVCDFTYLEQKTENNLTIRVYAPSDRVNQTQYARDVAETAVEFYTNKFNISYPLPKLDLISIPDFVSGAMEHWGLITFRETNILYDPDQASSANHQRVAIVVAHEVSHQWFGNLVTMAWWDDLWLNEGFASYMEYVGAAEHQPDWGMLDQFVIEDVQPVMQIDAGLSSHPIVVDVHDPAQINSVFDSISYNKGSSVIRMLMTWMGEDNFFEGVSTYLKKYSYKNARTDDLWAALGKIDDYPVSTVMDTWTKQMGLPYINFSIDSSGSVLTAEQHRFLADPSPVFDASESQFGYKWYIKLNLKTSEGMTKTSWMLPNESSVSIQLPINLTDNKAWIKLNLDETGFYRVNYPISIWQRLADTLKESNQTKLKATDRSNLLDDAFNLARAEILSYDVALNMTLYLDKETDYIPWDTAGNGFSYLSNMLKFTGDYGLLQNYIQSRISAVYNDVGFNDRAGTHLDKLKRSRILSLACEYGYRPCLNQSTNHFLDWLYNGKIIPPNLRDTVYMYGMEQSQSADDWNALWDRYKNETVAQEKSKLRTALSSTRTTWLLMRYIEYAQDPDNVREQDYFSVLAAIARNPVGRGLVWDWVREHWEQLVKRFGLYSRYFGRLVPAIVSNFNTNYQLEEVKTFFEKYPEAGAGANGRKQALESIQRNINWMKHNKETIVNWLKKHQGVPFDGIWT